MEQKAESNALYDLGTWLGRHQAFGLIAAKCSAAEATCLKTIREEKKYESLGLTWEEFCRQHAGISRPQADRIIQQLEEFGAAYFTLSQLVPVSPETYRALAPAVSADACIEYQGQKIPITRENAARVSQAVRGLREESARAAVGLPFTRRQSLAVLEGRMGHCLDQLAEIVRAETDYAQRACLRDLVERLSIRLEGILDLARLR